MQFVSTRANAPAVGLSQALSAGLAPDGGLYLPDHWPVMDAADFDGLDTLADIATRLLHPFFADDPLAEALPDICAEAFDLPLICRPLPLSNTWMLELFHGPTAAFKDFGARFLAACLQRIEQAAETSAPLTILVATSGDTGAAVGAAFHNRPGIQVRILYPDGRVSPRQAHQLGAFGGNVEAWRIAGSFDDCQALVKRALNDADLQQQLRLSSANSISLGRLLPQMAYYAQASLQHWRETGRALGFVVPTGNLGNALAALLVRRIGLPVGALHLACNANAVLPAFFSGNDYSPQPSVATLANAMDVGAPSNFERLRALHENDDALRQALTAASIDDERIRSVLQAAPHDIGTAVCPHTATALAVLADIRAVGDCDDYAVVATAHPAKFDTVLAPLLAAVPEPPEALATLLARPSAAHPLPAHYEALCAALLTPDPPLAESDPTTPIPRFSRPQTTRSESSRPRRWPGLMLVVLLSLALGLLSILAERDHLAADPRWRPGLAQLCATLGCTLPPWREPSALRITAREVRPLAGTPGALELLVSFRNDAAFAQAWPQLQVAFTDVDGKLLGERRFRVEQYLGGEPASPSIAVNQSVDARLELLDPGKQAIAFTLEFH